MMCDARAYAHRPTGHPARAVLAVAAGLTGTGAASAGPIDVAVWMESAQRCMQAVETSTALETEGYEALWATGEAEIPDWPEQQFWRRSKIAIEQVERMTGVTSPIRSCGTHMQPGVSPESISVIADNVIEWSGKLVEEERFAHKTTRRQVEDGTLIVMQSANDNPRGCTVAFEFVARPEIGVAELVIKEKAGRDCGTQHSSGESQ